MKTMMKMMVVLFLFCVLSVSADGQHEDLAIVGCSDFDKEKMYGLDGEVVTYVDFKNNKDVNPQPSFTDPIRYQGEVEHAKAQQEICKQNLKNSQKAFKDYPVERDPPSNMIVFPRDDVELGQENTLICYVAGFYPAPVNVTWTKNGQRVTEGIGYNVPYPNKDNTFNQISRLEFVPQQGDIYSCSVEHLALEEPETRTWDVETSQPSIGPSVFCGIGLTVGLLGVAAGTFFLIKGNECS